MSACWNYTQEDGQFVARYEYQGPNGETGYYRVKCVEVGPRLFNVYVNTPTGFANGAFGTMAQAEKWIMADRHRAAA